MSGERDLRKRLAALERRVATLILTGTVEANQGAKTKIRFDDAGAAGGPFSSPFIAQAASAGKNGQGVSEFTRMGIGEPALVFSPGGEIGEHSRVLPAGHVAEQPSPGTAEADGKVWRIGDAAIELKDGEMTITVGASVIRVQPGRITLKAPAIAMEKG